MDTFESFDGAIYKVNDRTFPEIALNLFHFQARNNTVYAEYLAGLGIDPQSIGQLEDIPFLPISFFKTKDVRTGNWQEETVFTSSGTTGADASRHLVRSRAFYLDNAVKCFSQFHGSPRDFVTLALLPSYLERTGSSLIFMVDHFIRSGAHEDSGYYKHDHRALAEKIAKLKGQPLKVVLWGVTFALLDFAESVSLDLDHCLVIETGGMKGKRPEITREEFHAILKHRLSLRNVSSEYGMTELMSQAYAKHDGVFETPAWMKVVIRDPEDPRERLPNGRAGGINVIDLANIHTCAFVETQDLGRTSENGSFEVLGRFDNSDIRGCNLLG